MLTVWGDTFLVTYIKTGIVFLMGITISIFLMYTYYRSKKLRSILKAIRAILSI